MAAPFSKDAFKRTVSLVALRIPASVTQKAVRAAKGFLAHLPRVRPVQRDEAAPDQRLILLSEECKGIDSLPADARASLSELGAREEHFSVTLGYDHMTAHEVLAQLLPDGVEVPSAFECAGHIARLNLRPEHEPFKGVIGQVLVDKLAPVRTVVNKLNNIETEFRTTPLEVIAGDDDMEVTLREGGAVFRFNFADVYWNSRLQTEHSRAIEHMQSTDVICACPPLPATSPSPPPHAPPPRAGDMMCGVGPFAIPAALRGLIEARGLGLLQAEVADPSVLVAVLDLDQTETERLPPERTTLLLDRELPLLHNSAHAYFPAALVQYLTGKGRIS